MHQDHAASPAGKTNLIIACIEKGRRADQAFAPWPGNRPETDFAGCRHGGSLEMGAIPCRYKSMSVQINSIESYVSKVAAM
jgi:hypothetical protein